MTSHFLATISYFPLASSQTNDQTVQRLSHCLDTDSYCLSHYIPGYMWQKQLLVLSLWCFFAFNLLGILKLSMKNLFGWSYVKISFRLRSLSWHVRTIHAVTRSGFTTQTFYSSSAPLWYQTSTHTPCDNYDLREEIMWQLLGLPGSLLCP